MACLDTTILIDLAGRASPRRRPAARKAARVFGSITGYLQEMGKPADDVDVLIAATAMVYGHTLITRNPKHFRHIPHLVVEEY